MVKRLLLTYLLFMFPLIAEEGVEVLLVLHSRQGEISEPDKDGESWKLTLIDVDQTVAFFSAMPKRRAGGMSIPQLLEFWEDIETELQKKEKGVGFVFFEFDTTSNNEVAVVIKNPKYDAQNDLLQFNVTLVDPDQQLENKVFDEVTVFIEVEDMPVDLGKTDLPAP